jgi:hypothetical protein
MSNILAALVGGLGAGAQSLGASRFQEQEQRRREEAAEQMRIKTAQEQGEQRRQLAQTADADRLRARTAGANSIRALFPDFEAPDGDFDPQVVLRGMLDRETSERQREREAGLNSRFTEGIDGRLRQIEALGNNNMAAINARLAANQDLTRAQIERLNAQTERDRAMSGAAGQGPPKKALPVTVQKEIDQLADVHSVVASALESVQQPGANKAVGFRNRVASVLLPDALANDAKNMMDKDGVAVRAKIANVFSTIGKLRSGGAITASEFERLRPFLPDDGERIEVSTQKLQGLEEAYRDIIQRRLDVYSQTYDTPDPEMIMGQGRGPQAQQQRPPQQPAGPASAPARPWETDAGFQAWKRSRQGGR